MSGARSKALPPSPPEIPDLARGLSFYPFQLAGMLLIMLLPVLALLGVFGLRTDTRRATSEVLALEVSYPAIWRHKQPALLTVVVQNQSDQAQDVTVALEAAYLERFAALSFTPMPSEVTESAYQVTLTQLGPGERKKLLVELAAHHAGQHRGSVRALAASEAAELVLSTLVLP